ncbi:PAS domain S-box protein [Spirulina subsalsa FACHB-351]|uniref:PAS domain S-box protein n=1 Tax=Spirulina subsalsa FACHB-351 TaxID=234711 RepID=A0ABT3L7D9_9CYAN|nr:PAS domain S-box protein [Spirulina subsalsa]MCW6037441.1 PAS domain S-box protein [Spirulina subsalsa FACHB-351]
MELFLALSLPVVVASVEDGAILYANEGFCSVFGLTPQQVIGHCSLEFYFESAAWQVLFQALLQYRSLTNYELKLRRIDGKPLWGLVSLQLMDWQGREVVLGVFQDITYPKQIEKALQERQQDLSSLTRNIPGTIYRIHQDPLWTCLFISDGCTDLTGYRPREFTRHRKLSWFDLIHPDDRERVREAIESVSPQESALSLEYRIITRQGQQKWVWDQGNGVFSQEGELIAVEGLITDITQRKSQEEEANLLNSLCLSIGEAEDLDSAIATILLNICQATGWNFGEAWVSNADHTALELSPAWCCYNPFNADAVDCSPLFQTFRQGSHNYHFKPGCGLPGRIWLTRKPYWSLDLSQDEGFLRAEIAQRCGFKTGFGVPIAVEGQIIAVLVFFSQHIQPWNQYLVDLVSTFAQRPEGITHHLGQLMQRKQIEAQLHASQQQLSRLVNAMPGIFFQADPNPPHWSMTYLSEGCCELTGYTSEELSRPHENAFDQIIHPEDRPTVLAAISEGAAVQRPYIVEYRIRTRSGAEKWVWEKGHGIYDPQGQLLGLEGFITDITDRKQSEEALRSQASELQALFSAMSDTILVFNAEGRYLKIARTKAAILVQPYEHLLNKTIHEVFPGAEASRYLALIQEALATGKTIRNFEYSLTIEGKEYWFSANICPTPDQTVVWVSRDITETKEAQESLAQAEVKYRSIFENALEGIFQSTADGHYLSVNPALARIYGYDSPDQLIDSLTNIGEQLYVDRRRRQEFVRQMQETGAVVGFESQIYRRDRSKVWICENARAVYDEAGQLLYYEGMVVDITPEKEIKQELHQRAFYDSLTNLPNRALFRMRLSEALRRSRSVSEQESQLSESREEFKFAVLFLDLDRFKVVNDSLGHLVGDELLKAIARRLEHCVRGHDTVARLGGDEFTILLEDIHSINIAIQVAERIEQSLSLPFHLNGYQVFTGVSIGIVYSSSIPGVQDPKDTLPIYYEQPDDVLRDADTALYQAKERGKGCYQVFTPTMYQTAMKRLKLELELREAIEEHHLVIHYQPIVDLTTGNLRGFEALLRWQHPQRGLLYPDSFLGLAEETGLIIPIGDWMLREVCQSLKVWQAENTLNFPLFVNLNCSRKQFLHPNLIEQIDQVCRETRIDSAWLSLEVTERLWTENREFTTARLVELQARRIKLCIDDFGMGYSCLNDLRQGVVNTLKIDRSFIREIETNPSSVEIARIIIMLSQSLGMDAIAEGIETETQLLKIQELGCSLAQGYFFSDALDAASARRLVEQQEAFCRNSGVR